MTFTYVESSENHDAWLEAKRHLFTATDAATIANSATSGWLQLKARKAGHGKPLDTPYMQWGIERETVIAQVMSEKYPWLAPNTHLVRSDEDPRWGATPDMIGDAGLCQIKTSLWKGERWSQPPQRYVDQQQWELHVTGLDENILAVEYYEETPHGFQVVDPFGPPQEFLIVRDDERIAYLVELAEKFFAMGEPDPMDALISDYAEAKARAEAAAQDVDAAMEKIIHQIGDRDTYKHVSELGSVSLSPPTPRKSLDKTAIERDFELSDEHYKTVTPKSRPRVTPAKDVA